MTALVPIAAGLLLALAGFAFWRPYLSAPQAAGWPVHAHAVLGVAWLLLLMVQPLLIRASMRPAHRLLGRLGAVLGGAFFLSGLVVAQRSLARMGAEQFAREGRFIYLPLLMALLFGAALVLALWWRSSPAVHGRFMAATLLPLLDPVLARLMFFYAPPLPYEPLYQLPAFALFGWLVLRMAATLPARVPGRRGFQVFSGAALLLLAGLFVIPDTNVWLGFVAWLRALPLS